MISKFIPKLILNSIYDIDIEFLIKQNIKGIIFDIDNTLVGFTVKEPDEKLINWLNNLMDNGLKLYIISNNSKERVETFTKNIDVNGVHRGLKPLTFKLRKAAKKMGLKCKDVALVGDQIYTDVLGGNLCGMYSIMVNPIDLKETRLFKFKRKMERYFINRYYRINKKCEE